MHRSEIPADVRAVLRRGAVIPAHPLALDAERRLVGIITQSDLVAALCRQDAGAHAAAD